MVDKIKSKVISHHLLRRRAQDRVEELNLRLTRAKYREMSGHSEVQTWLASQDLPLWTDRFEVRRARIHWHFTCVALSA